MTSLEIANMQINNGRIVTSEEACTQLTTTNINPPMILTPLLKEKEKDILAKDKAGEHITAAKVNDKITAKDKIKGSVGYVANTDT